MDFSAFLSKNIRKIGVFTLISALFLTFSACSPADNGKKEPINLTRSTYDGFTNEFINESIGMTFKVPNNWSILTEEEIVLEYLDNTVTAEEFTAWSADDIIQQPLIPDYVVRDENGKNNISVIYDNVELVTEGLNVTEEQYLQAVTDSIKYIAETNFSYDKDSKTLLSGQPFLVMQITSTADGTEFNQYMAVKKYGDFMAVITVTIFDELPIEDVWKMFI